MPTYEYVNTKTGETWSELRKISDRLEGVGGDVELVLACPKQADPSLFGNTKGQDFNDKVIAPRRHLGFK